MPLLVDLLPDKPQASPRSRLDITSLPDKPSLAESTTRSVIESAIPTATGAGASALLWPAAAAATPFLGPLAYAIPLAGGLAGAYAGSEAQRRLVPEDVQKQLFLRPEDVAAHPIATTLGQAVPSLATFKLGIPRTAPQLKLALASGGIQAGVEAGAEALRGEELSPGRIGAQFGVGAALNKPTRLGRKLFPEQALQKPPTPSQRTVLQPDLSVEQLLQMASDQQSNYAQMLAGFSNEVPGATVQNVRVKKLPKVQLKISEGKSPNTISDYLGGRIIVHHVDDVGPIIRKLDESGLRVGPSENMFVFDKLGYRGYHANVKLPNGLSAELQIHVPEMAAVLDQAHLVYDEYRYGRISFKELDEKTALLLRGAWNRYLSRVGPTVPIKVPGVVPTKPVTRPADVATTLFSRTMSDGGSTISVQGLEPTAGYMVSPYKAREFQLAKPLATDAHVQRYLRENQDLLSQPSHFLGTYISDDVVYLDVAVAHPDLEAALALGERHFQEAIWDVANQRAIDTQYGLAKRQVRDVPGLQPRQGIPPPVRAAGEPGNLAPPETTPEPGVLPEPTAGPAIRTSGRGDVGVATDVPELVSYPVREGTAPTEQAASFRAATDAHQDLANATVTGVQHRAGASGSVRLVASRIRQDLLNQGRVSFVGRRVSGPADLAAMAQIVRDPRFETLRLFYLKGTRIVGHEARSSRHPTSSKAFLGDVPGVESIEREAARDIYQIRSRMTRLGADGLYLLHNHPYSEPRPSRADVGLTRAFNRLFPGKLKGHVIIDDKEYAVLTALPDGSVKSRRSVLRRANLPAVEGVDVPNRSTQGKVSGKPPYLGTQLLRAGIDGFFIDEDALKRLAISLKTPEEYMSFIHLGADAHVNAVQEVHRNFIGKTDIQQLGNFVRNQRRNYGGANLSVYATFDQSSGGFSIRPSQHDTFNNLKVLYEDGYIDDFYYRVNTPRSYGSWEAYSDIMLRGKVRRYPVGQAQRVGTEPLRVEPSEPVEPLAGEMPPEPSQERSLAFRGLPVEAPDLRLSQQPSRPQMEVAGTEEITKSVQRLVNRDPADPIATEDVPRLFRRIGQALREGRIAAQDIPMLRDAGLDTIEAADLFEQAGTFSGQTLNRLSQVAKQIQALAPNLAKELQSQAKVPPTVWTRLANAPRQVVNIWRASLVSQLATAVRNFAVFNQRYAFRLIEDAVNGAYETAAKTSRPPQAFGPLLEDLASYARAFTPGNRERVLTAIQQLDPLLKERLWQTPVSDVALSGRYAKLLSTFNNAQEYFARTIVADAVLAGEQRRSGVPQLTVPMARKAVDRALDMTFAKYPRSKFGRAFVKTWNNPILNVLTYPFPRYLTNAVRAIWEHSPGAALKLIDPKYHRILRSGDPRAAVEVATKAALGSALFAAASWIRNSQFAGEKWYEVKVNGKTIDARPYGPLLPVYLFIAQAAKDPAQFELKDWAEGLLGINRMAGTTIFMTSMLAGKNPDTMKKKLAEFSGQFLGGFTIPLRTFQDFVAQFSEEDRKLRETRLSPLTGPAIANVPGLSRTLPEKRFMTRGGSVERESPGLRQLTGLTMRTKNPLEAELDRLGLSSFMLEPHLGERSIERAIVERIGPVAERNLNRIVQSPAYLRMEEEQKTELLRRWFSMARSGAKAAVIQETPAAVARPYRERYQRGTPQQRRALAESLQRKGLLRGSVPFELSR